MESSGTLTRSTESTAPSFGTHRGYVAGHLGLQSTEVVCAGPTVLHDGEGVLGGDDGGLGS